MFKQLYHVTHINNIESIYSAGLDPNHSAGKEAKVWLVDESALLWAIAHCADRHNEQIRYMVVIPVTPLVARVQQTRWKGVYTSNATLQASNHPTFASKLVDRLGMVEREATISK